MKLKLDAVLFIGIILMYVGMLLSLAQQMSNKHYKTGLTQAAKIMTKNMR